MNTCDLDWIINYILSFSAIGISFTFIGHSLIKICIYMMKHYTFILCLSLFDFYCYKNFNLYQNNFVFNWNYV
jgi:hypothetical protein